MTTTNTLTPAAASEQLRVRGFIVRPHGLKWLIKQTSSARVLTLSDDDLALAATLAQASADILTIDQLLAQLEATVEVDAPALPAVLSTNLQECARRYVAARRRSGDALLEAVAELAVARTQARHGEWELFLQAVGLDESRARAQLRIHEEAARDPKLAELIRTGWLTEAVARELLPAPAEVREAILSQEEPPTREQVREAKRAPAPVLETSPAPLPPAPDGWVIWQNEGSATIGMQHAGGHKLVGQDAQALIQEAESVGRWLTELHEGAWRVSYDPMCPAHLHAYTATHEHFAAIAAHDLPSLAYLAWRSDVFDDDLPDAWPDELVRGLYLAGEDVLDLAKQDFPIGRIYYLAGIEPPTITAPAPAPDCEECGAPATNKQNIGGLSQHRCGACTDAAFAQEQADQAAAALAAPTMPPPAPKGRADWWNCGREWKAVETAINAGDQLRAARAAAALTLTIAGDATRMALTQAEQAAQLLEAEGYSGVATVVRLLMGAESEVSQ